MKAERIIRRDDGSRVKIVVSAHFYGMHLPRWDVSTFVCEKGKRKFVNVVDCNCWKYRQLLMPERHRHHAEKAIETTSREVVEDVMLELWRKLKPSVDDLLREE